ncbi:hypothetical protein LWT73_24665, partial [Enterobacter hormaechei]|nr:hypothetical protein [Enterobacter hormaechei]
MNSALLLKQVSQRVKKGFLSEAFNNKCYLSSEGYISQYLLRTLTRQWSAVSEAPLSRFTKASASIRTELNHDKAKE